MKHDENQVLAGTHEENVMSRNELTDGGLDEVDRLLLRAMSKAGVQSGGAALSQELPEEYRNALASLGTPEEYAQRVMARAGCEALGSPHRSTFMATDASVSTIPTPHEGEGLGDDPEREDLLLRHQMCRQERHFGWNYKFVKDELPIGRGGQGTVYLANCLDPFVGQRALKVHSPSPYSNTKAYMKDMERLRSVAAVIHQINHDSLISVDRFDAHEGVYVLLMRLVDGFDLHKLLQADVLNALKQTVGEKRWLDLKSIVYAEVDHGHWGLAPGIAVYIIEKLLRALQVLHARNIIHCDVKLSNCMIDLHGCVRLIDIGSAFQLDAPPEQHAWTPWYAPPEVLKGGKWTPQGDLASLGYMLVELLSGRPDLMWPVANTDSVYDLDDNTRAGLVAAKQQLPARLKDLIPKKAQRAETLMTLCQRLIDPDPAARFESAAQAINHTAAFNEQLIMARLAVPWIWEIERWIRDVKDALLPSQPIDET